MGWQSAANSDRSLSFLRVEHVLYDGHRVVTEVILQYTEERELKVWLKSHKHTINLCDFPGFESALKKGRLIEKAKFVLNVVQNSSFCRGFKFDLPADTPISPDLYIKHEVRDLQEELEASEARVFSSNCLVLTNNAQGESCVNCVQTFKLLKHKRFTHRCELQMFLCKQLLSCSSKNWSCRPA